MKLLLVLIFFFFLNNCSFDNKTGIWKNDNNFDEKKENEIFNDFKSISNSYEEFDEEILLKENFIFKKSKPIENKSWEEIYFNSKNNLGNFSFDNSFNSILKSKKISRNRINDILVSKNILLASDLNGNIFTYDIELKEIKKFNFYKKKFKKIKKNLNIILKDDIAFISDKLGYLYAFNFKKQKIIWAKNYKIPFRSNLKIYKGNIIAIDQNNKIYFFDINTGEIIKFIPTEQNSVISQFKNSLSLSEKNLYFLNSYGTLYSIDLNSLQINWFLNINSSSDKEFTELFSAKEIISTKDKVIVSTNKFTYIIDSQSGNILKKKNFSSKTNIVVYENNIFLITKKNYLIAINLISNEIVYAYDIKKKIIGYDSKNKYSNKYHSLMIVNNNIFVFFDKKNIIEFNIDGELKKIIKLEENFFNQPIFVNKSLYYLDISNKLIIIN